MKSLHTEKADRFTSRRSCLIRPVPPEHRELGQALTETAVVAGFVLVPLLILGVYVGKWAYLQDRTIEAARYAAWERTIAPVHPPVERGWAYEKSDEDLANEVRIRFFGGRGERITAVTGSVNAAELAKGSSGEPLLRKHDGEPLLVEREKNIALSTREEAFDGGLAAGVLGGVGKLSSNRLQMTGPTVAAVTVSAAGLPQKIFREVGLGNPLQFKGQAAVLTDPWSASPAGEREVVYALLGPQVAVDKTLGAAFRLLAKGLGLLGLGLFSEVDGLDDNPLDKGRLPVDLQFGDRLQPKPAVPEYQGR